MKVNVKGRKISVRSVDYIKSDDENEIVGQFNKEKELIEILKNKPVKFTCETVIHELVHAFLYECGLVSLGDNEEVVVWFERNFLEIFDAFVDVFEYLYPGLKRKLTKCQNVTDSFEVKK